MTISPFSRDPTSSPLHGAPFPCCSPPPQFGFLLRIVIFDAPLYPSRVPSPPPPRRDREKSLLGPYSLRFIPALLLPPTPFSPTPFSSFASTEMFLPIQSLLKGISTSPPFSGGPLACSNPGVSWQTFSTSPEPCVHPFDSFCPNPLPPNQSFRMKTLRKKRKNPLSPIPTVPFPLKGGIPPIILQFSLFSVTFPVQSRWTFRQKETREMGRFPFYPSDSKGVWDFLNRITIFFFLSGILHVG